MKFLLDADVPRSLGAFLTSGGHDVVDVRDLAGAPPVDDQVYRKAQAEGRILITRDLDFSNFLRYPPTPHSGCIVLRTAQLSPPGLINMVAELLRRVPTASVSGALVIAQPGRYRIHRG